MSGRHHLHHRRQWLWLLEGFCSRPPIAAASHPDLARARLKHLLSQGHLASPGLWHPTIIGRQKVYYLYNSVSLQTITCPVLRLIRGDQNKGKLATDETKTPDMESVAPLSWQTLVIKGHKERRWVKAGDYQPSSNYTFTARQETKDEDEGERG